MLFAAFMTAMKTTIMVHSSKGDFMNKKSVLSINKTASNGQFMLEHVFVKHKKTIFNA